MILGFPIGDVIGAFAAGWIFLMVSIWLDRR